MVPELPEEIGNGLTPLIGVEIYFNQELCIGCGKCVDSICFVNAIKVQNGKVEIDSKTCRACGRCVEICKNEAISILITPNAVTRSIERVDRLVDVETK